MYTIPYEVLPPQVTDALSAKVDLKQGKLRYVRGLFVQALVSQAMSYGAYPQRDEKRDMARAIIREYPHL